jgi:hypothetical protein
VMPETKRRPIHVLTLQRAIDTFLTGHLSPT